MSINLKSFFNFKGFQIENFKGATKIVFYALFVRGHYFAHYGFT